MGLSGEDVYGILNPKLNNLEVKATNVLKNGDFSKGTNGFRGVDSNLEKTMDGLKVTSTHEGMFRLSIEALELSNEHVVYINIKGATFTNTNAVFPPRITGTGFPITPLEITEGINDYSFRTTLTGDVDLLYIRSYDKGVDASFELESIKVVDLTEAFGRGNEPSAKQMDNVFSQFPNSYFKGTQTITKEFMVMMLNEIDDIKNAVTTLGGNS